MVVEHDADIYAKQFIQRGIKLHSDYHSSDSNVEACFNLKGFDHASLSTTEATAGSDTFMNQQFSVGGNLNMRIQGDMTQDGGDITAGSANVQVSGTLTAITHTNTRDSHSHAAHLSTTGDVGASVSSQHDETLAGVSGIHTEGDANLEAHDINLIGAEITAAGKADVTADTINGESVSTHSHGDSFGLSGNVHDLEHNAGTTINTQHMTGSIDTADNNGHSIDHDHHAHYSADIPTHFVSGKPETMHEIPTPAETKADDVHDQDLADDFHMHDEIRSVDDGPLSDDAIVVDPEK